jgi:hemoglobin-like flavoprotein
MPVLSGWSNAYIEIGTILERKEEQVYMKYA